MKMVQWEKWLEEKLDAILVSQMMQVEFERDLEAEGMEVISDGGR